MTTYLGVNVTDTMESVRYLFNKYQWMAADVNADIKTLRKDRDIPAQIPITEAEKDKMIELYLKGLPIKEISKRVGRSGPSIYDTLKERKIYKRRNTNAISIEHKRKLIAERDSGKTFREVAEKYGVGISTLADWYKNPKINENIKRNR